MAAFVRIVNPVCLFKLNPTQMKELIKFQQSHINTGKISYHSFFKRVTKIKLKRKIYRAQFNNHSITILGFYNLITKYRAPHSKPFCTSIKSNNKEAVSSHDSVMMADSCIQRIKEIADDSSYLRIMVSNGKKDPTQIWPGCPNLICHKEVPINPALCGNKCFIIT